MHWNMLLGMKLNVLNMRRHTWRKRFDETLNATLFEMSLHSGAQIYVLLPRITARIHSHLHWNNTLAQWQQWADGSLVSHQIECEKKTVCDDKKRNKIKKFLFIVTPERKREQLNVQPNLPYYCGCISLA